MSIGESKEFFVLRKNPSQRGFRPSDYNLGDDRMRRTPSSIDAVVRWCAVTPTLEPPRASVPGVTSPTLPDLLTVAALAVIAYALSDFIHEGLGHGGSCLLIGGRPLLLSPSNFNAEFTARASSPPQAQSPISSSECFPGSPSISCAAPRACVTFFGF